MTAAPVPTPITDDAPAQRRAELARRVLVVLAIMWAVGMTLGGLYGVGLLRGSAEQLESCTTPGRECYDDGQKRSGRLVGDLASAQRDAAVFAAACADRPGVQGRDEIQACVLASFAEQRKDEQR